MGSRPVIGCVRDMNTSDRSIRDVRMAPLPPHRMRAGASETRSRVEKLLRTSIPIEHPGVISSLDLFVLLLAFGRSDWVRAPEKGMR